MDLIKIGSAPIGDEIVQTVNGRELHAFLGVGKAFANWIKDRIRQYDFNENNDFVVFANSGKNPTGGRPTQEYAITIDMAKELAMVERSPRGKQARAYFIECERRLIRGDVDNAPSVARQSEQRIFGTMTNIVRREINAAARDMEGRLTVQNRHLYKAILRPRSALALQALDYVEIGGVYRIAGLEPAGLHKQAVLSGRMSRALDAYCKRVGFVARSSPVGSRYVTHWPREAVVEWLSESGHDMVRRHITDPVRALHLAVDNSARQ